MGAAAGPSPSPKPKPLLLEVGAAAPRSVASAAGASAEVAVAALAVAGVEGSDLALAEFSPPASPEPSGGELAGGGEELALQRSPSSSSSLALVAATSSEAEPRAPARLSTVEYAGDHRGWKRAQLRRERPSLSARLLAAVVRRAQRLDPPPTPAFNLPAEGWGSDPAVVVAGLRKKRGPLKNTPKQPPRPGGGGSAWLGGGAQAVAQAKERRSGAGPSLDWACQSLRELPNADVKYFRHKTSVDLSHNPLSELPVGFGTLSSMRHLNLHDCDLEDGGLPQSLFTGLRHLAVLDLSCNLGLTEVPADFGSLARLTRLVLHGCRLVRVDDAVRKRSRGCRDADGENTHTHAPIYLFARARVAGCVVYEALFLVKVTAAAAAAVFLCLGGGFLNSSCNYCTCMFQIVRALSDLQLDAAGAAGAAAQPPHEPAPGPGAPPQAQLPRRGTQPGAVRDERGDAVPHAHTAHAVIHAIAATLSCIARSSLFSLYVFSFFFSFCFGAPSPRALWPALDRLFAHFFRPRRARVREHAELGGPQAAQPWREPPRGIHKKKERARR